MLERQLGYIVMLILNAICQYVYAIFWDRHRARFPEKIQKHGNIYKMMQRCGLDFFPRNVLGDGPAFWIFFSRIHG